MKFSRIIGAVMLAASIFFLSCSLQPDYTESDIAAGVTVSEDRGVFTLTTADTADDSPVLIFYPGGLVNPKAYLPVLSGIAAGGVLVELVSMPFDLAVFNQDAALGIAAGNSGRNIYIAGHSLGGVMAAGVCSRNPGIFSGLALWASYTTEDADLSSADLKVLSLRGSLDGVATPDEIAGYDSYLPADTRIRMIDGGNHSGFGSYGPQDGDNPAGITKVQQHAIIDEEMISFLN